MPECFGSGEEIKLGAYAVTEPQAGSDVKSLKTTAKRDGDEWVLNGTKVFITNGGIADVHVVVATVDPELGTRGQASFVDRQGHARPQPGQEGDEARDPRLAHRRDRARGLPDPGREPARRRGEAGEEAASAAAQARNRAAPTRWRPSRSPGRWSAPRRSGSPRPPTSGPSSTSTASPKAACRCCRRSAIQQTLADVATEIEAARLLVQRAAWMGRNGMPMTGGQGSMSKLKAGDVTMWATTTLMDLVGPYAWSTECPLEKWFRDAKIYQLFEGTAEIQRMVISRMQAREYAERLGYAAEVADEAMKRRAKEPVPPRKLGGPSARSRPEVHGHSHGYGAHALDARREDSRRRMWVALAINVGAASSPRRSAASSPARWRCWPTPATCSPTSARSSSR